MNNKQRNTGKSDKKSVFSVSAAHMIIAVVAVIECLVLVGFTTFSWIETASSLHIWNGKKSIVQQEEYTKMDIVDNLNYRYKVATAPGEMSVGASDLNTYFRSVKFYQFAKTSSPDGKTFYFKRPYSTEADPSYRKGDTTDYNTSYTYFDFNVLNKDYNGVEKIKFYFADADVFRISPGSSGLTSEECTKVESAMRISFQTNSGSPVIYSEFLSTQSGDTRTYSARSNTTSGIETVTAHRITTDMSHKLFAVSKNGNINVSCRIWLESEDSSISSYTAAQLAGLDIDINLQLAYTSNTYDFLYFDDYTFSNAQTNNGGHLTDDDLDETHNRMYFVYKTSSTGTGEVFPMTRDNSSTNPDATSWVTCDTNGTPSDTFPNTTNVKPYIDNLCASSGKTALDAQRYSYFAYGPCALNATSTSGLSDPQYTWYLNSKSNDDTEHRYNAFSVLQTKLTTSSSAVVYGAGGWKYNTPLTMIYFRDLATGLVSASFNQDEGNFKYVTASVNTAADTDTTQERHSVLYLSNSQDAIPDTNADNAMKNRAQISANMYYDANADNRNGLFKSWVPSSWTKSSTLSFNYCPGGYFCKGLSAVKWDAPEHFAAYDDTYEGDFIFTALGYNGVNTVAHYSTDNIYPASGSGTWYAVENEPIYFSTELIDSYVDSSERYDIGVIFPEHGSSYLRYSLIPDESNQRFYAYIPDPKNGDPESEDDYNGGDICFAGYDTYGDNQHAIVTINAQWLANNKYSYRTFYPVAFNSAAFTSDDYERGYWHIAVVVDGTYENLFWDADNNAPLGNLYYNIDGHPQEDPADLTEKYTDITANYLDHYRWYAPLDSDPDAQYVYFRWMPYNDVVFKYTHNLTDGIYYIVAEGANNPPAPGP